MEELQRLMKSINLANDKMRYLGQGFQDLKVHFEDISSDLDAFINIYEASQNKVNERLDKIEKHIGLCE